MISFPFDEERLEELRDKYNEPEDTEEDYYDAPEEGGVTSR